jgi:hypothetical protein
MNNSNLNQGRSINLNTVTSSFEKQRASVALEKLNKKKNNDLLEIQLNFQAKMGVTYKDAHGSQISHGGPYTKENRASTVQSGS